MKLLEGLILLLANENKLNHLALISIQAGTCGNKSNMLMKNRI